MCRCDSIVWFGRVGAHQSPRGLCATGWGYPAKLPIPMDKISANINVSGRCTATHAPGQFVEDLLRTQLSLCSH
ncbi:hypothetical protein UCMB321_1373 [Pseudomonas batumici]|uniref:Uncharacterized protein n=1 Tax=Pseudomonas batumici TaxID=226910 RepID=A0A0C2IDN1_9PSED|nr:hypothetical protein UCMB321_1373 [Pseudomonas batumici]